MHISSIKNELEWGDVSYYLLIMIWEMLNGLCKAADLLLGVCAAGRTLLKLCSHRILLGRKAGEMALNRTGEPESPLM